MRENNWRPMTAFKSKYHRRASYDDKIIHRIMVETVVSEEEAQQIFVELNELHESLREPFQHWLRTGSLDRAPEAQGYSIERLLAEGVTRGVPCAFLWIDALIKRPERALANLRRPTFFVPPPHGTNQRHH